MWHALIIGLILCPSDPAVPQQAPPQAWQALKEISLALEIVGPHENWATDFSAELRYVRRHYRSLRFAPPLADCSWLPSATLSREMCCFNECYQGHLQMQRIIYPYKSDQIDAVMAETRQLYCVWDAVRRANSPSESWALRRRMLLRLRDSIGDESYYRGDLPCWVPCFRFDGVTAVVKD